MAGADAAFSVNKQTVVAAAVVYDRIERRIVEVAHATHPIEFPYVPSFLSFREAPTVLDAIAKLRHEWGVVCFDGHGYAHPRRCGLAAHMSIMLNRPGVGIAKSRLIGIGGGTGHGTSERIPNSRADPAGRYRGYPAESPITAKIRRRVIYNPLPPETLEGTTISALS